MRRMRNLIISCCVLAVMAILGITMVYEIMSLDWSHRQRPLTIIAPRER